LEAWLVGVECIENEVHPQGGGGHQESGPGVNVANICVERLKKRGVGGLWAQGKEGHKAE